MGKALLIIVSGLLLVFGIHQVSVNNQQKAMAVRNADYAKKQQAKDIANSLVTMAISELNSDITWRTGFNYSSFLGGSGSLNVEDNSTNTSLGPFEILLNANGIYDGTNSRIQVLMRRTSYSKFAYFTNIEPTIYFVTGDTIQGPLHTNGTLHISGDPVFEGEVTSPNNWSGTGNPQFLKGYDFNSPTISLPTSLTDLANAASSGGLQLTSPSKIVFNSDGTIDVSQQVITRTWYGYIYTWSTPQTYNLSNYNGVISSTKDIYVKGDVNGQVTVHSSEDIHIVGDLTYADDPRTNPNSSDLLGLISDNNVVVDDGAETDHGTSDLTIDATIMALNSFTVQDYQSGSSRGQLNIFGGVVQNTRGAVGTFGTTYSGTTYTASGYSKFYRYDDRLMSRWPPGYPLIDSYSIVTWKE